MCERVDGRSVSRKVLESLIKSGACDCLGQTRATLFAQIDRTVARANSVIADRQRGQSSLFGTLEDRSSQMPEAITDLPEWPQHELLAHEKELLGFYVTGHPLTPYATILEKYTLANTATLAQLPNRTLTRIGGLVATVQNGISKKNGKPYSMVTLEDLEGSVQMLCMNENYDKYRELLVPNKAILVIGEINSGDDKPKIFPQEIMPLEDAPRRFTKQVHLRLHSGRAFGKMPIVSLFRAAHRASDFHGNPRKILCRPVARVAEGGGRLVRRRNVLCEGGHEFARARPKEMGAQGGACGSGGIEKLHDSNPKLQRKQNTQFTNDSYQGALEIVRLTGILSAERSRI